MVVPVVDMRIKNRTKLAIFANASIKLVHQSGDFFYGTKRVSASHYRVLVNKITIICILLRVAMLSNCNRLVAALQCVLAKSAWNRPASETIFLCYRI